MGKKFVGIQMNSELYNKLIEYKKKREAEAMRFVSVREIITDLVVKELSNED